MHQSDRTSSQCRFRVVERSLVSPQPRDRRARLLLSRSRDGCLLTTGNFDATFDANGLAFIDNVEIIEDAFNGGGIEEYGKPSFAQEFTSSNLDVHPTYTSVSARRLNVRRLPAPPLSKPAPSASDRRCGPVLASRRCCPMGRPTPRSVLTADYWADFYPDPSNTFDPGSSSTVFDAEVGANDYLYVAGGVYGADGRSEYEGLPAITRYSSAGVEDVPYLNNNRFPSGDVIVGFALQPSGRQPTRMSSLSIPAALSPASCQTEAMIAASAAMVAAEP